MFILLRVYIRVTLALSFLFNMVLAVTVHSYLIVVEQINVMAAVGLTAIG